MFSEYFITNFASYVDALHQCNYAFNVYSKLLRQDENLDFKIKYGNNTMRRLLIIIALLSAISSCAVTQQRERIVQTLFLDYRPFVEQGFFLSPDPYPGAFTALGDLSIKVFPAIIKTDKDKTDATFNERDNYAYYKGQTKETFTKEKLSGKELLQEAVDAAKALGANGIADLRITEIPAVPAAYVYGGEDTHWLISGICIYIPENK